MNQDDPGDTDTEAVARPSRRALLGAGLGVGVISTALAGLVDGPLSAGSPPIGDRELLGVAMRLELTARDLYERAVESGADLPLFVILSDQHQAYAQSLAGATGFSANVRDDAVFDRYAASFSTSDVAEVAAAAYELESVASATHNALLGVIEDAGYARLIASISIMEARHPAVAADAAGNGDDLDALLVNTADPLALEDVS